MNEDPFEAEFIQFLNDAIKRARGRATRSQWAFNGSRVALVVLAAALPALVSYGPSTVATTASVIVAALAGLDAQFKPGEQWRHHRSVQLTLMTMKREYDFLIKHGEAAPSENTSPTPFVRLRNNVEKYLEHEASKFFEFRITKWQEK